MFQEFYAFLLAYSALRVLMGQAALLAPVDPDRISFTQAIELVADALLLAPVLAPAHQCRLLAQVVADLSRPEWLLPPRRLRFNSRVIKRSRNRFQIKRADHLFFSAKHFLFLSDPPHASFRDFIVI